MKGDYSEFPFFFLTGMTSNDIDGPREVKLNPILILGSVYSKKLIQFLKIT